MSKKNRHIEHLTPELIKAYRNGELTREEQHEVERLMLENPLYDEALEGLDEFTNEMLDADLNELDNRLDALLAEEDQPTGFWNIWRGIAAAALIILTIGSLLILKQDKPLPTKLLTENNELKKADSTQKETDIKQLTDSLTVTSKAQNSDSSTDSNIELQPMEDAFEESLAEEIIESDLDIDLIDVESKTLTIESLAQFREDSINLVIPMNQMNAQMEQTIAQSNVSDLLQGKVAGLKIQSEPQMRQSLVAPPPAQPSAELITVKGKVTGADDGLPLPQVTVLIKGTTNGKATDIDGNYSIADLSKGSTLVFRYLGYVTQEVEVRDQTQVNVQLNPDTTSLGEVVVTGVAAADPEKALSFSVTEITYASPIEGYPNFNQYLKDNLQYPEEAKTENIKGRVTVEFTVEADGSLTNFEIIRSLGYGCDEEAIRLIKEGPQWQARTRGVNQTPVSSQVRVRIRFRP